MFNLPIYKKFLIFGNGLKKGITERNKENQKVKEAKEKLVKFQKSNL
jgi:hypothetical protein